MWPKVIKIGRIEFRFHVVTHSSILQQGRQHRIGVWDRHGRGQFDASLNFHNDLLLLHVRPSRTPMCARDIVSIGAPSVTWRCASALTSFLSCLGGSRGTNLGVGRQMLCPIMIGSFYEIPWVACESRFGHTHQRPSYLKHDLFIITPTVQPSWAQSIGNPMPLEKSWP